MDQWARDTAHFACRGLFHARKGPHRFEGLILSLNDRDHETLGGRESENLQLEEEEAAQALLAPLNERERLVLWRRYVAGEYGARIAKSMGFSGSYINRVEKRALEKLREIHGQANQAWHHRNVPRGRPTLAPLPLTPTAGTLDWNTPVTMASSPRSSSSTPLRWSIPRPPPPRPPLRKGRTWKMRDSPIARQRRSSRNSSQMFPSYWAASGKPQAGRRSQSVPLIPPFFRTPLPGMGGILMSGGEIIGTIVGGCVAIITVGMPAILALLKIRELHVLVNSRITELLEATKRMAAAEGEIVGRNALRAEIAEQAIADTATRPVLTPETHP